MHATTEFFFLRHRKLAWCQQLLLALWLLTGSAFAQSQPSKVIAGWVEPIAVQGADFTVKAKLDSGAATSSIHAKNVRTFKRKGKRWARFDLVLSPSMGSDSAVIPMETRVVRRVRIKEHIGQYDRRMVVTMGICFNGQRYNPQFTLADRSRFIYPVLLGRRFLEEVALVDSGATFLTQAGCQPVAEAH